MKEIPLSKGKVALVDDEDFDENEHPWCIDDSGKTYGLFYARRNIYSNKKGRQKTIRMHRIIMEKILGRKLKKGEWVDHINHDGLDNRRCNLRLCNGSQNKKNCEGYENNTSGFNGVCWSKDHKKWQAYIGKNGHQIHLGRFDIIEEAASAVDKKAVELYGEFAVLNFPLEETEDVKSVGSEKNGKLLLS